MFAFFCLLFFDPWFQKLVTRSKKLFVLGLFVINGAGDWQHVRFPGVLQRFAICYIIGNGITVILHNI